MGLAPTPANHVNKQTNNFKRDFSLWRQAIGQNLKSSFVIGQIIVIANNAIFKIPTLITQTNQSKL